MNKILITGAAGFIGFHLVSRFLKKSDILVFGLDNLNNYYDINLKLSRLDQHGIRLRSNNNNSYISSDKYSNYTFVKGDISDSEFLSALMASQKFDFVVNLAAQAGVRYSIDNPSEYLNSNINGFLNILEGCRVNYVKHLVYASTSSVYGLNKKMPLSERMPSDHPISLYSATKKSNEMMAHAYSHLFNIPTTGLRFFTVYGPWGRPDMALFKFTKLIFEGKAIDIYNHGEMIRDFTYIDDVVEGVFRIISQIPKSNHSWDAYSPESNSSSAPFRIFNLGNSSPVKLGNYIDALEKAIGVKVLRNFIEYQPGDVYITHADMSLFFQETSFKPNTDIYYGVSRFVEWYKGYYGI